MWKWVLVGGCTCVLIFWLYTGRSTHVRCQANLTALGKVINGLYRPQAQGEFPSLAGVALSYSNCPFFFLCPGTCRQAGGDPGEVGEWSDYIYLRWTNGATTPGLFPLLYDKSLSNHNGQGINILRVDGEVFWDQGGRWLRQFAEEHPTLNVIFPADMAIIDKKKSSGTGNVVDDK